MKFVDYLKLKKVLPARKDIPQATGLMQGSLEDLGQLKTLPLSEGNASLMVKNLYDCLRAALHAFLARDGYTPYSHEAILQYALEKGWITPQEARLIDKFRILRNDIAYRAARATREEAQRIRDLAQRLVPRLRRQLEENT